MHGNEITPDLSIFMTTMLTLDNDKLFQAQAEYRRLTRPGMDPTIRKTYIKVCLHSIFGCHQVLIWIFQENLK